MSRDIIKYIESNSINPIIYYYDKIPLSIWKNISIQKSKYIYISVECYNIKKPKTNGLLYGYINEIAEIINNIIIFDYIFCAPTIFAILLCLFRFKNTRIILFPYLLTTSMKYDYYQLLNIINDLKKIFNNDIDFDFTYIHDYININGLNFYKYIYNIVDFNYCSILCITEETYNMYNTHIYISKQQRDYNMKLRNIINEDINIKCNYIYNFPIIHQIIAKYKKV